MAEGICGTCSSPIVVRDGRALSVIDRSFIEERDRYRAALEEIVKWRGADAGASQAADIAQEALQPVPQNDTEEPNAA